MGRRAKGRVGVFQTNYPRPRKDAIMQCPVVLVRYALPAIATPGRVWPSMAFGRTRRCHAASRQTLATPLIDDCHLLCCSPVLRNRRIGAHQPYVLASCTGIHRSTADRRLLQLSFLTYCLTASAGACWRSDRTRQMPRWDDTDFKDRCRCKLDTQSLMSNRLHAC